MGRYPTPEEAKERFVSGVQLSKEKWVERAIGGADDYLTWFTGFASRIYPLIAGLPEKTGDVKANVINRSAPVASAIHSLSVAYRRTKLAELARKVAPVVR